MYVCMKGPAVCMEGPAVVTLGHEYCISVEHGMCTYKYLLKHFVFGGLPYCILYFTEGVFCSSVEMIYL